MSIDASDALQHYRALILRAASALGMVESGAKSVSELMAVLCRESTSTETILSLIEQQPLLAARILRVANSAYYGYSRSVTTLHRAIAVLGTQAVRGIAVTCSLDRVMSHKLAGALPDPSEYLRHSIATAIAAQELASAARAAPPQEAYVGGMLHNIGVAIQTCVDPSAVRKLSDLRRSDVSTPIRELEAKHCEVAHEMCGGVALAAWQLPTRIVSAAAHHHAPIGAPPDARGFAALIGVAAALATSCGCGFQLEELLPTIPIDTARCAQVEERHVQSVAATLQDRVSSLLDALSPA
jgi:HD-like signal output (HDOD) protein